jgi:hypothetical protein
VLAGDWRQAAPAKAKSRAVTIAILAFGGGEILTWTPWPVWILGGLLALHAGWLVGYRIGARLGR